jgi:hypothetical protein
LKRALYGDEDTDKLKKVFMVVVVLQDSEEKSEGRFKITMGN